MKFRFFIFKYGLYSLIFLAIGISAYFNHKIIETLLLFISYVSFRYMYPKTFHHSSFYWCIFWSITIFWVAIPISIPRNISILFSIILGSYIGFSLFKVKDYIDNKNDVLLIKKELDILKAENANLTKINTKSIETMTRIEFENYAINKGINISYRHTAWLIYHELLKGKDLYEASGYSESQIKRIRKVLIKNLE